MPRLRRNGYQNLLVFDRAGSWHIERAVSCSTILLLALVRIQWLPYEYEIDGFRKIILKAMLDLNGPTPLTPERTDMLSDAHTSSDGMEAIGFTTRTLLFASSVFCKASITFLRSHDRWLCPIFDVSESSYFNKITQDRMLPIVYWPTWTQRVFDCCPGQHVLKISQPHENTCSCLLREWADIALRPLRLMKCSIDLKQHRMFCPYLHPSPFQLDA